MSAVFVDHRTLIASMHARAVEAQRWYHAGLAALALGWPMQREERDNIEWVGLTQEQAERECIDLINRGQA